MENGVSSFVLNLFQLWALLFTGCTQDFLLHVLAAAAECPSLPRAGLSGCSSPCWAEVRGAVIPALRSCGCCQDSGASSGSCRNLGCSVLAAGLSPWPQGPGVGWLFPCLFLPALVYIWLIRSCKMSALCLLQVILKTKNRSPSQLADRAIFFFSWRGELKFLEQQEQSKQTSRQCLIWTDRRSDWNSPWINSVLVFWQDLCASSWENTPVLLNKIRYPLQPCGEDQSIVKENEAEE